MNKQQSSLSWDKVASWYIGWVGTEGSKHHKTIVIPKVLELLSIKKDEKILDIGCGHGVFAKYISNLKAKYYGIDKSEILISNAKKHFSDYGQFRVSDIASRSFKNPFDIKLFDKGLFMLSIQDIDPLDITMSNVSGMIKPGGSIVIFMLHPAFRVPRQSGFGYDENRKLYYRRVDSYLSLNKVPYKTDEKKNKIFTFFYHRPLSEYFRVFKTNGLVVTDIIEVEGPENRDKATSRANKEIPLFLAIRCVKSKIF